MSEAAADRQAQEQGYPAAVAAVLDKYRIVINRGMEDGVDVGERFLLYELSDAEVVDPVTGEFLGQLEIPKGTGEVIHAQDHMSTIESDQYKEASKTIIKRNWWHPEEEEHVTPSSRPTAFHDPKVGDPVKPIYY